LDVKIFLSSVDFSACTEDSDKEKGSKYTPVNFDGDACTLAEEKYSVV